MSSGSERKFSVEELMEMNRATPSKMENPPMEREWSQLLTLQAQAVKLLGQITEWTEDYPAPPSLYPVTERLTAMEQEMKALRQTVENLEQAGRKKERRSYKWLDWLPDFSLTVVVKWVALVLIIVGALLVIVNGVATVVGNIRSLLL